MKRAKMGRPPVDDPKAERFSIRLDKATAEILDAYCEKHNKKRAEGIRDGINRLKDDPKVK